VTVPTELPSLVLVVSVALLVAFSLPSRPRPVRQLPPRRRRRRPSPLTRSSAPWLSLAAGSLPLAVAPGLSGALAGVVLACSSARWLARAPRRQPTLREIEEYALLVDLLAACLSAGAPLPRALASAATASDGPLSEALRQAGDRWLLGASMREVAEALVEATPQFAQLADVLVQAEGGAGIAKSVQQLARDARHERRARSLTAARAVGARAAAPLALCFLPAFLLVSVVPLLAVTAGDLLR